MPSLFPRWMNTFPTAMAVGGALAFTSVVGGFWYYATPKFFAVGYSPTQPGGGFSHQIHAGKLGMDCRYCHTKVEKSAEANIPNVATCFGCHADGRLAALNAGTAHREKTDFIRQAYAQDASIPWRRVHKVPDYVRNFPHQVHINAGVLAGVSCYSCHGSILKMPVVHQVQPLSMSWCLDCHRNPGPNLVPKDKVTDLLWAEQYLSQGGSATPAANQPSAQQLLESLHNAPPENCGACHY